MKRIIIISILAAILLSLCSCDTKSIKKADIIRIHIRANSNSSEDQEIKYIVKDSIVEYITPLSNEVSTKAEMYKLLSENMDSILETAEATLESEGYEYGANIRLDKEMFPLRSYDGVTFESGEYDALIIELGSGTGDNWWCVAYPPLCFIAASDNGTDDFEYKSKILEMFRKE